jgi:predicted transcriptional regulator
MKQMIRIDTEQQFFQRGMRIARLADAGKTLPKESVVSFEDPADLLSVLSPARLGVFQQALMKADSITGLAQRLARDRSAVKRDVDELAKHGLLCVEDQALPGHGRQRWIKPVASRVTLQAVLA